MYKHITAEELMDMCPKDASRYFVDGWVDYCKDEYRSQNHTFSYASTEYWAGKKAAEKLHKVSSNIENN